MHGGLTAKMVGAPQTEYKRPSGKASGLAQAPASRVIPHPHSPKKSKNQTKDSYS